MYGEILWRKEILVMLFEAFLEARIVKIVRSIYL